ncbi:MAG: hypothetical protein LBB34_02035 [Holosporales bacterium]|nr:hypothetical protein [Holosporales bacterium]
MKNKVCLWVVLAAFLSLNAFADDGKKVDEKDTKSDSSLFGNEKSGDEGKDAKSDIDSLKNDEKDKKLEDGLDKDSKKNKLADGLNKDTLTDGDDAFGDLDKDKKDEDKKDKKDEDK